MAEKSVFSYKGTVLPIVLKALTFATTSQLGCKCWADLFCCKSACLLIWAEKKYLESWNYFFIPPIWLASFMLKFFSTRYRKNSSEIFCFFLHTTIQNKSRSILTFRLEKLICVFLHSFKLVEKKTATQLFSSKYFSE